MVHPTTKFKKKKGSREDVWKGIAQETAGGLKKKDLMISKTGNIVSKKASESASERMKSGDGLCGYCIKQYKLGKIKNISDKKSTKKSTKKDERKLKEKKPKGASEKKINELQKEINSLRSKAGRITEREGTITKEVKKILENITKKAKERILMKKFLKNKEKKKLR